MAKATSKWSETLVFERMGKRLSSKGKLESNDLPEIYASFFQLVVERRVNRGYELLEKRIERESDRLFIILANAIGVKGMLYNPYAEYDPQGGIWPRLGRKYAKKKKSERFWYYKGHLRNWLLDNNNKPSLVFGRPNLTYARNPNARGRQWATISVTPYPNVKNPNLPTNGIENETDSIRNRLFGRRPVGGGFESNEEMRPIVAPVIRYLINNRITDVMKKTIKEAVENG